MTGYDDSRRKRRGSLPAHVTAYVPNVAKSAGMRAAMFDNPRPVLH